MVVQINLQLWKWIRHTLRKGSWATEKQALCWNPQGQCRRGRPRRSRITIEEETEIMYNTWGEFRATAGNKSPLALRHGGPMLQSGVTGS